MTQIKVILGKVKITKNIELPLYTYWDHGTSYIISRFSLKEGKLVQDEIVVSYDDDDADVIKNVRSGQTIYEKIASTEDTWDMSGWSEYTFDTHLTDKKDWKRMRKLLKKAYKATK